MATWQDLRDYVHGRYRVAEESPGLMSLSFDLNNRRSQLVLISHTQMKKNREGWIHIESAFADRTQVHDIWSILDEISEYVVGGLSVTGSYLTLRHSVPLADMSVDEFESPLEAVMFAADNLEKMLSRVDTF